MLHDWLTVDLNEMLPAADLNIIIFDLKANAPTAATLVKTLGQKGILIGAFGERRVRIVTHLDVNPKAGEILVEELAKHLDK